jgi:tetratricopeptide (TPR) repeat protein
MAVNKLKLCLLIVFALAVIADCYAGSPEIEALNKGAGLAKSGKFQESIVEFNKAISLKPDYYKAYSNRGLAYLKLNKFDRAIADFDKALDLKPDYAAAYNGRGITYAQKKEYSRSLSDLLKAKSLGYNVNEGLLAAVSLTGKTNVVTQIEAQITSVDLNNSTINLYNPLGSFKVRVLADASITNSGVNLKLKDLKTGQLVTVRLDGKEPGTDSYRTGKVELGINKE